MTRRWLIFALKLGISAGLLGWLIVQFDFAPVFAQMRAMHPGWLAAAFVVLMAHGFVSAWRWWAIMRLQGDAPGYGPTLKLFFIGMFFNQTLSTTLGGDAARVWLLRASGISTGKAATGVVLERAAGMLSMLALVPAAILVAPLSGRGTWFAMIAAGAVLVSIILFGPRVARHPVAMDPQHRDIPAGSPARAAVPGRNTDPDPVIGDPSGQRVYGLARCHGRRRITGPAGLPDPVTAGTVAGDNADFPWRLGRAGSGAGRHVRPVRYRNGTRARHFHHTGVAGDDGRFARRRLMAYSRPDNACSTHTARLKVIAAPA